MSHPFTSQRRALIIYSLVWLLIAIGNGVLLFYTRDFPLTVAITEALVNNILFALLGLIVWYPTRYIPFNRETPLYSFFAHAAAGVIVIMAWLLISYGIMNSIFSEDAHYNEYLVSSFIWRAFTGVMVYLVLVLIYYVISYGRRLRERAQAEEKLRTLVRESELNMLKSQINPHFLFNSLNSISSLILTNPEEAREMIIRLSDFLRYSLKHREDEFVSLEEEIKRMKDYLSIEQVRFGEKLIYTLELEDDCKKVKVPTMILQPLVENAIKHGVYESLEPVKVCFSCSLNGEVLRLDLVNDYDPELPKRKGTGVGLQNVSERIRLAYEGKGRLNWSVDEGKFRVSLFIPIS